MIAQEVVNGKPATVTYVNANWKPCAPKDAALVKVVYNDGSGVLFGVASKPVTQA